MDVNKWSIIQLRPFQIGARFFGNYLLHFLTFLRWGIAIVFAASKYYWENSQFDERSRI